MPPNEIPDEKWNVPEKKGSRGRRRKVPLPDPEKELQSYYQYLELKGEEREHSSPSRERGGCQTRLDSRF